MISTLVAHHIRTWRAGVFRGRNSWQRKLGFMLGVAFEGLLAVGLFAGSYSIFRLLERSQPELSPSMLSLIFAISLLLAVLSLLGVVFSQLFLASDLEFLMASPVSLPSLFTAKLLEAWIAAASLVGALSASVLLGFGLATRAPFWFFPAALIVLVATLLIAAALNFLLVMAIARIMPARMIRGVLAFLGAVIGAILWLAFQIFAADRDEPQFPRPTPLPYPSPFSTPFEGSDEPSAFFDFSPPRLAWLPTTWGARALVLLATNEWGGAGIHLLGLAAATGAGVAAAFTLFRRTFYQGRSRLQDVPSRKRTRRGAGVRAWITSFLPSPTRSLVLKEWLSIPRDARYLAGIIFPLVATTYFSLRGFSGGGPLGAGSPLVLLIFVPIPLLTLFLCSAIVLPTFGMEGRNFALLRIASLNARQIMMGKIVAFLPGMLVVASLVASVLGVSRNLPVPTLVAALGIVAWLTFGQVVLSVGAAALGANFEAERIQKAAGPAGTLTSLLGGVFFSATNGGFAAYLALVAGRPGGVRGQVLLLVFLFVLALAGVALVAVVFWSGAKALETWEVQ